jgi:hypothetical protein
VRLTLSGGFAAPRARSDIFDLVTDELTLERGDFASPAFALSAAVRVAPRVEVGISTSYAGRTADSESRDFTGEDDLPILQSTTLDRATIMATGRISLLAPGRHGAAWIPTAWSLRGGRGARWYRLRQNEVRRPETSTSSRTRSNRRGGR